jgi:hypothetical protein
MPTSFTISFSKLKKSYYTKKNLSKFQPIMVLQSMPQENILRSKILEGNAQNPPNFFCGRCFIKYKIIT